jgi:hypothetical protein
VGAGGRDGGGNPVWHHGIRIFAGTHLFPTASPLPYFGYPFLVLTFIGWIWTLLREKDTKL